MLNAVFKDKLVKKVISCGTLGVALVSQSQAQISSVRGTPSDSSLDTHSQAVETYNSSGGISEIKTPDPTLSWYQEKVGETEGGAPVMTGKHYLAEVSGNGTITVKQPNELFQMALPFQWLVETQVRVDAEALQWDSVPFVAEDGSKVQKGQDYDVVFTSSRSVAFLKSKGSNRPLITNMNTVPYDQTEARDQEPEPTSVETDVADVQEPNETNQLLESSSAPAPQREVFRVSTGSNVPVEVFYHLNQNN